MKLKKSKDVDYVDLTEEERKEFWAKEMLDNLGTTFPVMTSIGKKDEAVRISYWGLGRLVQLSEYLVYKAKRFRTISEVFRASQYLGTIILYWLCKDEGTEEQKARADQICKTIQAMENINHSKIIVDAVTITCAEMIACQKTGIIDGEQLDERIDSLIESLPKELRPLAREKVKRLKHGENVIDISETRLPGKKRMAG